MNLDDRLSGALEDAARRVQPNSVAALDDVHGRARQRLARLRRRRVTALALVAAIVAVIAGLLVAGPSVRDASGPAPATHGAPPNPFRVVHTYSAGSLGLTHLLGVAASPNGALYVTDRSGSVAEVSRRGRLVHRWGSVGQGAGQFRFDIGSIAVDPSGRVYVSDSGNSRIQVFSPSGRYLRSVGGFGRATGKFLWPFDVAVDAHGDIYVSDDRAATLTKLAPDGAPLWRVGGLHEKSTDLKGHQHFQGFDARGRLVTTNDDEGLVLYLRANGTVAGGFGSPSSGGHEFLAITGKGVFPDGACDATVDPGGSIYVTSCQDRTEPHHTTRVFDKTGRLTGLWRKDELARSPVFVDNDTAFGVTYDGSLVELSVTE
jgi:sugar lactone lactonase YvrE